MNSFHETNNGAYKQNIEYDTNAVLRDSHINAFFNI